MPLRASLDEVIAEEDGMFPLPVSVSLPEEDDEEEEEEGEENAKIPNDISTLSTSRVTAA